MDVNIEQCYDLVIDIIKGKKVANIVSSPGIGKSDLVRKIAKSLKLKVVDIRLAQCDPMDLVGLPNMDRTNNVTKLGSTDNTIKRSCYAPPDMYPLEGDTIPKGYIGWLLFFDEMNSAPLSVQASAYRIILDRMVGQHNLHKKVIMMCAGNRTSDRAVVNRLSTAMQSRLIHLNIVADHKVWLNWADDNDIDYRIKSFIHFKPDLLHYFNPKHTDDTFPTPRTWSFLSDMIKPMVVLEDKKLPLIVGTIGNGTAIEFLEYSKIFGQLPTLEDLLISPETTPIPDEPSVQYAMSTMLAKEINEGNVDTLMLYVNRLPGEFQVITLTNTIKKNNKLIDHDCIETWITEHAEEFI